MAQAEAGPFYLLSNYSAPENNTVRCAKTRCRICTLYGSAAACGYGVAARGRFDVKLGEVFYIVLSSTPVDGAVRSPPHINRAHFRGALAKIGARELDEVWWWVEIDDDATAKRRARGT